MSLRGVDKLTGTQLSRYFAFLLLVGVLAPIALVSSAAFAQAPPGIPMVVSGTVTLNGSPAPDGLNVTAWDGSQLVGATTISGGNYTVEVCGTAGQTCSGGDTISFQLDQLTSSQTTTFGSGTSVTLNLSFTGTPTQAAQTTATTTTNATLGPPPVPTTTPEYPNYLPVILVAVLITLGIIATLGRKNRRE